MTMGMLDIRKDRTRAALRKLAKAKAESRVQRHILAIANALSGMNRKAAVESAGMDRQTLRDWVIRTTQTASPVSPIRGKAAVRRS
jgi:transposase